MTNQLFSLEESFNALKEKHESRIESVKKKEELLETLTTGISAEQGHENGFMDQLQGILDLNFVFQDCPLKSLDSAAKTAISTSTSRMEQIKLKLSHLSKELKEKEPKAAKAESLNKNTLIAIEALSSEIAELKVRRSSCFFRSRVILTLFFLGIE
jgi:structural maintenance of chromosome 2